MRLLGELARKLVDEPVLLAIAHRTDSATSEQDAQREVEFRRFMAMPEVQHIELMGAKVPTFDPGDPADIAACIERELRDGAAQIAAV